MITNARIAAFLGFVMLVAAPILMAEQAPTGSYTATTGGTAVGGGGSTSGGSHGHGGTSTGSTAGKTLTMNVASYTTQEELQKLAATQGDPKKFLDTLKGFNHGTVMIGSKSYVINAAASAKAGSSSYVVMLSATPFEASGSSRSAKGVAAGYIRLTVDDAGAGTGMLYTSTQVVVSTTSGDFTAKGGASTATQLTAVARQ